MAAVVSSLRYPLLFGSLTQFLHKLLADLVVFELLRIDALLEILIYLIRHLKFPGGRNGGMCVGIFVGIIKYPEVAHQVVGESAEVTPFHLHVGESDRRRRAPPLPWSVL